jgi:hypothetical protein
MVQFPSSKALHAAARRRWRHYETAGGSRPVLEFIRKIPDGDKAAVLAAMKEVCRDGTRAAWHVGGERL